MFHLFSDPTERTPGYLGKKVLHGQSTPPSADIAWLRKAVKSLLKTWRSDGCDDKLSDAQFALAREYGFASWHAL